MSCPAREANAYAADERLTTKPALEVPAFPDCAPPRRETSFKSGDTGSIVSSILKAASAQPESEQRLALDQQNRRFHTSYFISPMRLPAGA
jgi:hypothetical protein